MSTNAEMRLRNESKDDERDEAVSLRRCLDRIRESLHRLGSAVNSSGSMILRLEEDLLDQRNSVDVIETRLLKVEGELIGATGETHLDEASDESPPAPESESSTPTEPGTDVDDEADRSNEIENSSNSTKLLLQKSIAGTDSQKSKSISYRSSDSLDFDLLKTVFQCVMHLSRASRVRQAEASCRLIQRIFRGYVVRRNIQETERRSFNVSRLKRSEESLAISSSEDVDQVFTNDNHLPSTVTSKSDDDINSAGVETEIQDESTRKSKQSLKSSLAKFLTSPKHSHQQQRQDSAQRQPQQQQPRASLPSILSPSSSSSPSGGRRSWSVAELNDSAADDGFVSGRRDLHQLQTFLSSKISEQKERLRKKQPSVPDVIFCQTLEDIHSQLLTSKNPAETTEKTSDANYSYNDLMSNFEAVLDEKLSHQIASEQFVNAFRAILNEFLKKKSQRKDSSNDKQKKEANKKKTTTMQAISESASAAAAAAVEGGVGQVTFQSANRCSSSVPEFVAQLMDEVESRGLSIVGIYRVAGNSIKIKQLIKALDDSKSGDVDFSVLDIHVMTSVLKSFLRNLPQPLIACHVYEELAPNWSKVTPNDVTTEERTRMLNDLYNKLLPHHQKLLDRLLSHLARVALNESMNLMSTNALAITFTPCLLRLLPSENSLSIEALKTPVQRQTEFVQSLIEAKLQELKKEKEAEGPEMNSPDADDVSVDLVSTSGTGDDVIEEENHSYSNDVNSTEVSDDVVDDAFAAYDDIDADHVADSSSTDEETGGAPNDLRPL